VFLIAISKSFDARLDVFDLASHYYFIESPIHDSYLSFCHVPLVDAVLNSTILFNRSSSNTLGSILDDSWEFVQIEVFLFLFNFTFVTCERFSHIIIFACMTFARCCIFAHIHR